MGGEAGAGWQDIVLPFESFRPVFRAKTVPQDEAVPLDSSSIVSLQIMLSKFEYDGELNPSFKAGPFSLPISSIRTYSASSSAQEEEKPRFVYVSSAGVTRPNRPGIDVDAEPPAVKLNDDLGGILTYKLKGEDYVRESGLCFTIVRPCALTEEDEGADIVVGQGDTIKGKISREDVADLMSLCVLDGGLAKAKNVTFEIKTTQPFSEPFVKPSEGFVPKTAQDWEKELADVKQGVTGKTIDGVYTGTMTEAEATKANTTAA